MKKEETEMSDQGDTAPNSNTPCESTVRVILDDEETEINVPTDETILEAALNADLDAPFSCQGGVCTSCMAKIVEGKAIMEKNTVLTDEELEEGLILTCQAHPTTAQVTIDYDDV